MIPLLLAFACLPVDGLKLLARHFTAAIPEFSQLAPDAELGYAPLPGVVRTIRPDELQRMAWKLGVTLTPPLAVLCFEWPMQPVDAARVQQAMQNALPADAHVEILELSRVPLPEGALEFSLATLQGSVWRGVVRYGGGGRFEVWARVRVAVRQTRVVTLAPFRTGELFVGGQLRLEEFEDAPVPGLVTSLEAAIGMVSKRNLPAGSALKSQWIAAPAAIAKGDTVRLRVTVGIAHVVTAASAQASGRIGQMIPVKNATTGRILQARIEGPGEVRINQ